MPDTGDIQTIWQCVTAPWNFSCATRKERKLSKIDGSFRFLLDLKDLCHNAGTPLPPQVVLASLAAEFCHTFVSNGDFPTPQSIARGIMDARFTSENAKTLYAKRKTIIEPLFGWTKENRNFKKFQRRGLGICKGEWKLICLTQNILKFSADMKARTLSLALAVIEPVIDLLEDFQQFLLFQLLSRRVFN